MMSLLPWWVKPVGIVVLIVAVIAIGWRIRNSIYNEGYNAAVVQWSAKYNQREADLIEKAAKERDRQIAENNRAKRLEAVRIAQLEAENQALEDLIKEKSDEADKDPDRDRIGVSDGGRMRIDSIR